MYGNIEFFFYFITLHLYVLLRICSSATFNAGSLRFNTGLEQWVGSSD